MLENLVLLANKLDAKGYSGLATELEDIIIAIAMDKEPVLMNKEELEDDAENIIMAMSHAFQQAGYNVPAQELFEVLEQVGFDAQAIIRELRRRRQ